MLEPHIAPPACVTEDAFAALMEISKRPPVVFVEGRGSWLTDQEGKKYLDFIQGWAVNCLGHCPTAIVSAIKSQAEQLLNCGPAYYNAPMIRLAELIARYSGLHRTFFTNSGILGEVLKEFSIATECGFGRRPAETIPQLRTMPR